MNYEDPTVSVQDDGITIRRYGMFGSTKVVPFDAVVALTELPLGALGKWRLAGAGPGTGWRNWYGWDNARRTKDTAYAFDIGGFWRPAVTPDDAALFAAALPDHIERR